MARKRLPVGARRVRADGYVYIKQPDGTWKKSGKGVGSKRTGKKVYKSRRKRSSSSTSGWKDFKE